MLPNKSLTISGQGWGLWVTSLQQPPVRTDKLLFTVEKLLLFFSFVMQPGAFSSLKLKSILREICVWCTCRALVTVTPGVPLFTEWMFTLTEHCHVHCPLDGLLSPSSAVCHSCIFVVVYYQTISDNSEWPITWQLAVFFYFTNIFKNEKLVRLVSLSIFTGFSVKR